MEALGKNREAVRISDRQGRIAMPGQETETEEIKAEAAPAPPKGALALDVEARRDMMPTSDSGAMQPANLGEAMEFARILAGSDMVPKDYIDKPGNVLVAIQMGAELGLAPMQAIQNIAVINGRPSLWGDAMLAVVMAHPAFGSFEEMSMEEIGKAQGATCVLTRKGRAPHTSTFSVDDAKTAGLWGKGGPWKNYPNRMLMLRARAFACRNVFPDALRGIQSAEEVTDIVEVVATVKSSAPSSVLARIKARQTDSEEPVTTPDPEPSDAMANDDDPSHEPSNGEMSDEEEARMAAEQGGES